MAKTPQGQGREYTNDAPGVGNENGKASATPAGGDPVHSPVRGNPGEAQPQGYDYALAAANAPGAEAEVGRSAAVAAAPAQAQAAGTDPNYKVVDGRSIVRPGSPADTQDYADRVRAIRKGYYHGIREVGDGFNNVDNLPTYPEDPTSWFVDSDAEPAERPSGRRRRAGESEPQRRRG